jgi:hypothetical protein
MFTETARAKSEILKLYVLHSHPDGWDHDIEGRLVMGELMRTSSPGHIRSNQRLYNEMRHEVSGVWSLSMSEKTRMGARWDYRGPKHEYIIPDQPDIVLPFLPDKALLFAIWAIKFWGGARPFRCQSDACRRH